MTSTDKFFPEIEIRNQELKPLERVFHKLIDLTEEFCRNVKNDAPYWYNERANVSFLAGAIWRCGGMCLEEYASDKTWEKEKYPGRTDIWFYLDGKEYIAEAKFGWIKIPEDLTLALLNCPSGIRQP